MRLRMMAVLACAAVTAVACEVGELEDIDLSGNLTASPLTAAVGQEVTVTIEGNGNRLLSFLIDYDDDTEPEFLSIAGSREARWTRVKTFDAPGTYDIMGRIDEIEDTLTRTVTVTVTGPATSAAPALSPFELLPRK